MGFQIAVCERGLFLTGIRPAKHNSGREKSGVPGKGTGAVGFFSNMADGLDTDAVSAPFGRLEYPVFFSDFSVKSIFNLNQKQAIGVHIDLYSDLASHRGGINNSYFHV